MKMERLLFSLIIGVGIAAAMLGLMSVRAAPEDWNIQTVDSAGNVGKHTSLALDASGYPRISYYNDTNDDLKYAHWNGSAWSIETVDSTGTIGLYTSLALDSDGHPHISYYDDTKDDLKYAHLEGSAWISQTVDITGTVGLYTSLALDSDGHPHISYRDNTNSDLKYAHWTGSAWSIGTVDGVGTNVGEHTSLALDASDDPHISYFDLTNTSLKYAHWSGSGWISGTVDSGNVGTYSSLALDGDGHAHISYYDSTNSDLKYAHWGGSAWISETVDSVGSVGFFTSLALDSDGYAHISYRDTDNSDLKYAHWDGSAWNIETVDGAGSVGQYTSLALDARGSPHISYYDLDKFDLKYASLKGVQLEVEKSASPSSAKPGDPITYTIRFSNTGVVTATGVVITDTLSASITGANYTSSGVALTPISGALYAWSAPDLLPGDGGAITITGELVKPLAAGTFTNTVIISATGVIAEAKAPITVENVAPVANAGEDQTQNANSTVTLDGSGSSDDNGGDLTYGWVQTGGSPAVTLSNAAAISPTFTAPDVTTVLTFTLTVTDTGGLTDSDETVITVNALKLEVDKSASPASAKPGDPISYTIHFTNTGALTAEDVVITDTLSASITGANYSSSNAAFTLVTGSRYVWTAPVLLPDDGGVITITGELVKPLAAGTFTNTVIVSGTGVIAEAKAPITVQNVAPVADAGEDQTQAVSTTVTLDGSGSSDDNGGVLTYGWAQTGGSPVVTLSDSTAISPTFTAPSASTVLTFTLTVTDTGGLTDTDVVVITVNYIYYLPCIPNNTPASLAADVGQADSLSYPVPAPSEANVVKLNQPRRR